MTSSRRGRLQVRGGPDEGRIIHLRDPVTIMGRAATCDIVVDERRVSRQHAIIRGQHNGFWIEDMGSQNGTFVNGQSVDAEGQRLRDGDGIELGGGGTLLWVFNEPNATEQIPRPLPG